jgi:hypothetical protein
MSFRPYNCSYTYYKGILVERRGGFAIYGWTGVVNITLIDTSIPELKSKLGLGEAGDRNPADPRTAKHTGTLHILDNILYSDTRGLRCSRLHGSQEEKTEAGPSNASH